MDFVKQKQAELRTKLGEVPALEKAEVRKHINLENANFCRLGVNNLTKHE